MNILAKLRKFWAYADPYYMERLKIKQESLHIEVWNNLVDMKRAGHIVAYTIKDIGLYDSRIDVELVISNEVDSVALEQALSRNGFKCTSPVLAKGDMLGTVSCSK